MANRILPLLQALDFLLFHSILDSGLKANFVKRTLHPPLGARFHPHALCTIEDVDSHKHAIQSSMVKK
ncbi:hypothetical protein N7463_007847 [Penicillium fimorum]|uniref:Uncharacterized protein n=1 Tax=Penicillium fimorum TaxID=1882269 RepID=A0A9W9XX60_9EURO|nr:hypothetical protein N7463_007847 [Penicillium fimorum]